ncbi:helix-turn-helix domain-containing protein [Ihubacter sp. mB4P-1]|uniref:helix-turn-helix domain-containing protein n=1 Tax=Ihubacter sp. mB4P-1 TaxID=3242370 RepID=UPI003C7A8665
MMVSYNGLWKIMIDKGLQKQDLVSKAGLSSATVAKMGKGEPVSNKVLEKLANFLECNVGEIISFE